MSVFRKRERRVPELNTAALPDLIFTVLFFFMIVTHMRSTEDTISYETPKATNLEEVKRHEWVYDVYIGRMANVEKGSPADTICIRMNGKTMTPAAISAFMNAERALMTPEELQNVMVNIRADRRVEMGVVNEVKRALRSSMPIKINYEAEEVEPEEVGWK